MAKARMMIAPNTATKIRITASQSMSDDLKESGSLHQ